MTTQTATKPTLEQEIAERFARDTAHHQLTVLHDDGLYRHLRAQKPGSSTFWFEIATWPGSLAIRGDYGDSYVFSRTDDMFGFFRRNGNTLGINPGYWAEKLGDRGRSVMKHSEDTARRRIDECIDEYETDVFPDLLATYQADLERRGSLPWPRQFQAGTTVAPIEPPSPASIRDLVDEYADDGALDDPDGVRDLLRKLEGLGLASDTWEWDLTDWDWPYLWACHAIVWAIAAYDTATGAAPAAPQVVTVEVPGVSL